MAEQVDEGKPRRYIDRSGTIYYALNFHHHAKRVNIDRCNDVRASVALVTVVVVDAKMENLHDAID